MRASRLVAAAVGLIPVVPVVALVSPTPAPAAPHVACPAVTSAVAPPAGPAVPRIDPKHRSVGGDALDTAGLASPAGARRPPAVTATSWLVADLGSGAVLGGCGPHEYRTPASVQKLLLAATFLPRLEPAEVVKVTRADLDFEPGSSAVGLLEGGRYSVESLWLALLLRSGNDAANVLARIGGGAGGRPAGIQAMNEEARRLGAHQTHAVTPSGLDGAGQFTSAYDLALIARACFAREDFRRYVATRVARIGPRPGTGFQITNDNGLLDRYPGMLGGKTGFTDLARQTYVGVADRGGRRLVVTLLGAESQPLGSLREASALLDWGFALPPAASVGNLVTPEAGSRPFLGMTGLGLGAAVVLVLAVAVAVRRRAVGRRAAARRGARRRSR